MASPDKPGLHEEALMEEGEDDDEHDDDGKQSYYSEQSYRSEDDQSYYSEEERGLRPDEGSTPHGSYRSGEGSYRSSQGSSYRSGEGSYRSGEGSYRSSQGSHKNRDQSYRSDDVSYRSEERSYRSEDKERSGRSGDVSYRSGEGSYRSGEGSYRSREGSYRSGDESYRSREGSYRSGDGSCRSGTGSYRSGDSKSFAIEDGHPSFRRDERSYRSDEDSYRSSQDSYIQEGLDRPSDQTDQKKIGRRASSSAGDSDSHSPPGYAHRDDDMSSKEEGSSFSDDADDTASFGEEDVDRYSNQNQSPSEAPAEPVSFQDSRQSMGTSSEIDSEAPSFAEESDFSPYSKSPKKAINTPPIVFENGGFGDDAFGKPTVTDDEIDDKEAMPFPSDGFFNCNGNGGNGIEATFDNFGNDAFGVDAFVTTTTDIGFGSGDDAFGKEFGADAFGLNNTGTDNFAPAAFAESKASKAHGRNIVPDRISKSLESESEESDADERQSFGDFSHSLEGEIPPGESTNSFAQKPGAATEPEMPKSDITSCIATKANETPNPGDLFNDAFDADAFDADTHLSGSQKLMTTETSMAIDPFVMDSFGGGLGASNAVFGEAFVPSFAEQTEQAGAMIGDTGFDAFEEAAFDYQDNKGNDPIHAKEWLSADEASSHSPLGFNGGRSNHSQEALNTEQKKLSPSMLDQSFTSSVGSSVLPPGDEESSQSPVRSFAARASFPFKVESNGTNEESFKRSKSSLVEKCKGRDSSNEEENSDEKSFHSHNGSQGSYHSGDHSVEKSFHSGYESEASDHSGDQATEKSFYSEDGSQASSRSGNRSDGKSLHPGDESQASYHSGDQAAEKSFYSEDGSQASSPSGNRSDEKSLHQSQASYRSGDQTDQKSLHSEDGSQASYRSGDQSDGKSFYSGEESQASYRSGDKTEEKSFHSEDESHASYRSGDPSDGKSVYSGDESQASYRSGGQADKKALHSGDESQGSYHSEDLSDRKSFQSRDEPQLSYRSEDLADEKSFHTEDGSQDSYRSGEQSDGKSFGDKSKTSYRSGDQIDGKSFHSEDGSQASYRDGGPSYGNSFRSGDESQASYHSRDQTDEKPFHSEDESQASYRSGDQSDGNSFHSGDESQASYCSGDLKNEKSFHSEDGSQASFHSGDQSDGKSFHSYDESQVSYRSRDQASEKSFHSGAESQGSYHSDDQAEEKSFHSEDVSQGSSRRKDELYDNSKDMSQGTFRSEDQSNQERDRAFSQNGDDPHLEDEVSMKSTYRSQRSQGHNSQSNTNSAEFDVDPTFDEVSRKSDKTSIRSEGSVAAESIRSGNDSAQSGDASYFSGESGQQSDKEEKSLQESSGRSLEDEVSETHDGRADMDSSRTPSSSAEEAQVQLNETDPSMSGDEEESIGIGDVFGKPKEFFEHQSPSSRQNSVHKSQRHDSYKSQATQDETVDDGSKISPRKQNPPKKIPDDKRVVPAPADNARSSRPKDQKLETKPKTVSKPKQKEDPEEKRRRKKRKKKLQREAKSQALLDLVANVNDAMLELEEREAQASEGKENNTDTSAHRLLHGFDALLGIFLQLSDELELIATFAKAQKKKDRDALAPVQALKAVLSFAATLDELFADLKPIILECFEEEPDEEMDDMLYRLNSLVDLLYEATHRVGERQEWNERAETTYVTLLELMDREATELISYYEDVETPEQVLSANIHEAWSATGHIEELRALQFATDPWLFRQLCYEVMVSTDQWCPDTTILMEICGIDPSMLEEEPDEEYLEEDELPLIPQAAEHVLDKVNGDPLPRTATLASILRRILPPRAVTDATLLDHFTSIRNTLRNPLGLSATNIVSISSVPEQPSDPDSLGVGGMGKSTLAAMVARHPDVRRYFIDGVVWVYVGDKELNYNRYTQCLRELVAQLDFYQGVPLFAELLHVPGETLSKRRRREEGFMIYARDTIAELLHDRSVLIILDDVCFEPDLDWFDFAPMPGEETDELESNCALLVTTRCRTLLPAADTVEVDMLDEADAISLLIQESGQLSHTLMAESREARSVVRECANHPLAVKSVGRWLNLKHATAGVVSSVEEIHSEVIKSMDKILKGGDHTGTDMMYEILSMSLSPAINGEPTSIIKFCLAAFIVVFCDREYISDFALTEPTPIIPMDMAELLFETLLEMNESSLLQKGSLFYAQKKEAAVLIPEALSALGVLKVITYSDAEEEEDPEDEQKFLQVMHFIHHEYGEYLCNEEEALKDLTKDAERQWNRALVEAYLSQVEEWDMDLEDAGHSYALEMIISHMIRGGMYSAAADLLADKSFVRGRLLSLGRENSTRRHLKDCELLFKKLKERRPKGSKLEPRPVMKQSYQTLGSQLALEDEEQTTEDSRIKDVEVARAHYEIGFSLAEKRCWDAAIAHWETSQEILVSALGTVEVVAGILFNIGVVYSEMNEYEQALDSLKQCLRIRGTIHGEEHILYAQTIQKIGDIFLGMSDYHEATESYNWALDVMYIEPNIHRVEIGEILDNKGTIHYSKGEIDEALQCHQEALRSKQVELGEDHPELAATYHHIGNCLSDQGNVDDAIVHFEEAIRLKELDPEGGPERDADVLTIEGILHNLEGNQEQGLECYEKSLQILVTKVPHRKEKVASLLHLIGCVYLMSGEQKKAMKLFEESLQARRKVLGFVHLDVASTLFNMAFLHQTRNRLDRALKCLEEALKIRQLRLPDSEKVAVTHEKIGSLARAIGKTKKAQINFEDALRIRRLLHGEQHEAVATVLQELGDLMDDLGEYDSAMSYYIDALDIRRNRLGLDDIAVAETLYSMGYTLHNNDEPDRALVCFEESLNIRRYQLGEDSKEVGDTLNMMGFLKAKRGELDDALTLLWDALRIRKLQEDHVKVSETLKNIGNVHREKQEQDLAVECYEECLRIRRSELGVDHEKVADALIAMGNVQGDMERNDEAMRSYQEALKIRTLVFGEHDESVAAVLQYMGTMEFRANNHEKARDLLTEFIRIRRDNDTKNDGDYVNVLFMIGNIHKMQNHEDEAQLCWSEAYQVFQELGLAENNPHIAKVMSHLLKAEEEKEEADQKKKGKGGSVFGKVTDKLKGNLKEEKVKKKKSRKGKGIKL